MKKNTRSAGRSRGPAKRFSKPGAKRSGFQGKKRQKDAPFSSTRRSEGAEGEGEGFRSRPARKSFRPEKSDRRSRYSPGRDEKTWESGSGQERQSGEGSGRPGEKKNPGTFKKEYSREKGEAGREGSYGKRPFKKDFKKPFDAKRPSFKKDFDSKDRSESGGEKRYGKRPFKKDFQKPFEAKRSPFKKDFDSRDRSESGGERSYDKRPFNKDFKKPFDAKRPSWKKDEEGGTAGEGYGERRKWNRKEDHSFYGDRKKGKKAAPVTKAADDGSTRLNKYISNAGICSRREADEMIAAGVITVNGEVITKMGHKVMPGDEVRYNNETLRTEKMVYLLVNKPKDFITTADDPGNRKTVMSLIEGACRERVYPVGRLDRNTTGLLLFTNDGELARRLTHPSFEVQKIYQVDLDKNLKPGDMDQIAAGVHLEDGFVRPDAVSYVGSGSDKSVVGVELHSGKNRIVRRIFESLDYKVKKLDRVYFAGLSKKDLPRGRWRHLTEMEVASLKMMTGDKRFKSLPPQDKFVAID